MSQISKKNMRIANNPHIFYYSLWLHNQRTAIIRRQCFRLNELSREIANLWRLGFFNVQLGG